jgi:hypothetical protein
MENLGECLSCDKLADEIQQLHSRIADLEEDDRRWQKASLVKIMETLGGLNRLILKAIKHTEAISEKSFGDEVIGEEDCRDEGYLDGTRDALIAINDFLDGDPHNLTKLAGEES